MKAKTVQLEYAPDYQEDDVEDDAENDSTLSPDRYEISSYGIDFDVKGLIDRLRAGKIFIPEFQRSFVWRMPDSSRFIESLLLGLPVPGIFLAKEAESQKLFVIDGQQRLKSLQFFYDGVFNPVEGKESQRVFKLTDVQKPYNGKGYADLDERSRQMLDDSVLHATVVKQDTPKDDDTSIYHVYERLNSGGRRLHPQEIRTAICHGPIIDEIKTANNYGAWRKLFGPKSIRLKDEEMILRFMALYASPDTYQRPMEDFLTKFATRHRTLSSRPVKASIDHFKKSCDLALEAFGPKAFRPERNFNAAVFDSVTYGIARALTKNKRLSDADLRKGYTHLLKDTEFIEATSRSTADEKFVEKRLKKAEKAFAA